MLITFPRQNGFWKDLQCTFIRTLPVLFSLPYHSMREMRSKNMTNRGKVHNDFSTFIHVFNPAWPVQFFIFFPKNIQYIGLLFQNISRVSVEEYGKHLQSALNLRHANARLLSFCCTTLPEEQQPQVVYQWPVRCRRRPLIKQPHHILDLPNFKAGFCMC